MKQEIQELNSAENRQSTKGKMQVKDTYLSVDLDAFQEDIDVDWLQEMISSVGPRNVACAINHHHILCHMDRYHACTTLINLDFHSDMAGPFNVQFDDGSVADWPSPLNAANWVDYVDWPKKACYLWAYPYPVCLAEVGRCDLLDMDVPFDQLPHSGHPSTPWQVLKALEVQRPDVIDLSTVKAASIALSPHFCTSAGLQVFRNLVRSFGLELLDTLPEDLEEIRLRPSQSWLDFLAKLKSRPRPPSQKQLAREEPASDCGQIR